MQFKHPEILWALLLLLIPIVIHLLQLRRFKKTPFTNVAMLQQLVSESRKSQHLKKWLLLFTRLLLLTALVTAFAQPFSSKSDALAKRETVVYLDNSFSMQAKKDGLSLIQKAVQDMIHQIPETTIFTLFTNGRTFKNSTIKKVQNELLSLEVSSSQLSLEQIKLKASSLFSNNDGTIKEMVVISDLQERKPPVENFKGAIRFNLVQPLPDKRDNVYIDSLYLGQADGNQVPLNIQVVGLAEGETLPISLYDDDRLIAKTAVKGNNTKIVISTLSLENGKSIKGRVVIEDHTLRFDNHFFFNIDGRKKPKVLAISGESTSFLERIFSEDGFEYLSFDPSTLNYSVLESQNTVVLNGLKTVSNSLATVLWEYSKNGGTLVVIPSMGDIDIRAYNRFLEPLAPVKFKARISVAQDISGISFEHPLYKNAFEKEVTNFDYPKVGSYYEMATNVPSALSYTDTQAFLVSYKNTYIFSASLKTDNSSFINSPLVVPTFYTIGENSLKNPTLYHIVGREQSVDVAQRIGKDNILKLYHPENEFIPLQQSFSNKVRLQFGDNPKKEGIYAVMDGRDTIQNLSFNYPRNESRLNYLPGNTLEGVYQYTNIPHLFEKLREDTSITDYWKWFVIFALLFAVLELLIQKLLP